MTKQAHKKPSKKTVKSPSAPVEERKKPEVMPATSTTAPHLDSLSESAVAAGPTPFKVRSAPKILRSGLGVLWRNRKLFIGITLVYIALNLLFVQSFSGGDSSGTKTTLSHILGNGASDATGTLFAYMVGAAGASSSDAGSTYQLGFVFVVSLAIIWALREIYAGRKVKRVRDAFYSGMAPLVPFVLVLVVFGLQLIPVVVGSAIYSTVVTNGVAAAGIEKLLWFMLLIATAAWSFYWATPSVFALYIVTEPGMTPKESRRIAREALKTCRWRMLFKILFLPLMLLLAATLIMLPAILVLTPLANAILFTRQM